MEHRQNKPQPKEEVDYGDFEEVVDEGAQANPQQNIVAPTRVRVPRQGELIGVIVQRLGGNRMEVRATDGKTRNCRVPGRFSRSMWLRPKDTVLIKPWEFDNTKADVIFKYDGNAANQLKKRGMLVNLKDEF
jgi:translation initiation factor 1A